MLPVDYDTSIARNPHHIPVRAVIHEDDSTLGLRPQVDLLSDPSDPH
jgi:hypothetical protein